MSKGPDNSVEKMDNDETLTVLFADDDAALRGPLAAFLRKQGFHVLEAEDGNEALEVARKYDGPIHLLVSDILMPNMDGTAVAALLSAARPEMRILLISGFADDLVCQKDWAFMRKPFRAQELLAAVQSVLGRNGA